MQRTKRSRRAARLLTVATVALLAMGLSSCESGGTPVADYQFHGNRLPCSGSDASALTTLGTLTFANESVDGKTWRVQRFPEGSGLRLPNTNNIVSNGSWTIAVLFRFVEVSGYGRLIDFKNSTTDTGAYEYYKQLNFYPHATGASTKLDGTFAQAVFTRSSSGQVVGYVDGHQELSFSDTANDGVIAANTLRFFQDNQAGSAQTEDSAGAVARIRIWDHPLSASDVSSLGQLPSEACATG